MYIYRKSFGSLRDCTAKVKLECKVSFFMFGYFIKSLILPEYVYMYVYMYICMCVVLFVRTGPIRIF